MPSTSTPVPEVQHLDGAAPSSEEMVENIELTEEEDAKFQRNLNAVTAADPASQLAGATATNEQTNATFASASAPSANFSQGINTSFMKTTNFKTTIHPTGGFSITSIPADVDFDSIPNDNNPRAPGSGQPMTTSNFISIIGRRIGFRNVILPANAMVHVIDDTTGEDPDMIQNQINGRAPGSGQPLTASNFLTMSGPRSGFRNVYIPANAIVHMITDDDDERAPSQGGASASAPTANSTPSISTSSMTILRTGKGPSIAFESVRIPVNAFIPSIPNDANSPSKSATLAGGSINHLNNDGMAKNNKKSFDFRMFFNGDKFPKF